MKPLSPQKRAFYLIIAVAIFLIGIPVLVLYSLGYRIGGYNIVERGAVHVYVDKTDASIFIDGKLERKTGFFQKEIFEQNMKLGEHIVVVEHPEYERWQKQFFVKPRTVASFEAYLHPKEIVVDEVPMYELVDNKLATSSVYKKNKDYDEALDLFEEDMKEENSLATSSAKSFGKITVWYEDGVIYADYDSRGGWLPEYFCLELCQSPLVISLSEEDIKNIDFYPDRQDVILYSTKNDVFVAEIDIRPQQIIRKIYSSSNPVDFRVKDGKNVYIRDNQKLLEWKI